MAFFVHHLDTPARTNNKTKLQSSSVFTGKAEGKYAKQYQAVRLEHIEEFKVLLCATCQYCILPNALDHHLKRLHHLPWSTRQCLIKQAYTLSLASCKEDVPVPSPDNAPISTLPRYNGYICMSKTCQHMCMTTKRMEAHWREDHSEHDRQTTAQNMRSRPTKLQTFFKGNQLRYFQVADLPPATPRTGRTITSENATLRLRSPTLDLDRKETSIDWMVTRSFDERDWQNLVPIRGTEASWKDRILQVSTSVDYLKYIVLSMTASQIAFTRPESSKKFHLEADRYRQLAIRNFPANWAQGGPQKFFEVFNFARLMTMSYIATAQLVERKGTIEDTVRQPVLPRWVTIQRQGRALTWPFRGQSRIANALHGPAERLLTVYQLPKASTAFWPHEERIDSLATALRNITDMNVDPACSEALELLRKVWTVPYQENVVSFRDMTLSWTVRVSDRFIELVQIHDPFALLVFGHFCVLWTHAEEPYWYMKGHAEIMLLRVLYYLDPRWHAWLAWPIDMVLTKHTGLANVWSTVLPVQRQWLRYGQDM